MLVKITGKRYEEVLTVSSRQIAEDFEKSHREVIYSIEGRTSDTERNSGTEIKNKGIIPMLIPVSYTHLRNKTMHTAALGAANARLLTKAELDNLLAEEFGLTIEKCDEQFGFIKGDGSRGTQRYFKEDKVTIYTADPSGRIGTGLWLSLIHI